jgi:plasmid stabilization system protein ParE
LAEGYTVVYRRRAKDHVRAATDWYRAEAPGQVERFLGELERLTALIQSVPLAFRRDEVLDARRVGLDGFPYTLWFNVEGNRVSVLAITHTSRGPKYIGKTVRQ